MANNSSPRIALEKADDSGVRLTAKPHAFGGAVLSPKHARELTPGLSLAIASALSSDFPRNTIVPYTVWITEAWRVLGWAEPSAALFWELATMYHTLYLAIRVGESDDRIPPILSCGSHSSMGSAPPEQKHQRQMYSTTAKELPVWFIGTFLLLHCEESSNRMSSKSDTDQTSANSISWQQKQQSTRPRSHAGQQDQYTCFILRHLRKILLLLAVPHNDDAVRACIHLAALPTAGSSVSSDVSVIEKWHAEEHGSVGLGVRLTMDDLERLHFVLQLPSGGCIDDPPLNIGKFLWKIIYRSTSIPGNVSIPLGEVERVLRHQLIEGYQKFRPEIAMAKLSLSDSQKAPPPQKSVGPSRELCYNGLRGTTILLKPDATEADRLHDLVITDCNDCHFYLLQPFVHATISFSTGCIVVVGAVAGLLHVVECEKTQLTSAARRLVISNSSDVLAHAFTPSPPLLVGDNRNCQLAPYNSYYDGLREDLLATGLAAAILNEAPPSPTGATSWPLQCASNKWKQPVELAKLELPHIDEDASKTSTDDAAMQTPILLPASDFQILFVPFIHESKENHDSEATSDHTESQYCRLLAQVLQLSPFQLPTEYERQALVKADRMRTLQTLMKSLTTEQLGRLEDELNRGFREWLVTSGNLRQVLDLVHLEKRSDC